ncbi:hypothetical protein C7S15_1671 [Burkholderia cepacia]|nr:hypothetical protein [Burkholderia cepacia]
MPTLPADDLVYTTCEISVITRYRPIFEIVRIIGTRSAGLVESRTSE